MFLEPILRRLPAPGSARFGSLAAITLYLGFFLAVVPITYILYRADLSNDEANRDTGPPYSSAAVAANTPTSITVAARVKSVDTLAATAIIGFAITPSADLIAPSNASNGNAVIVGFFGSPGAFEPINIAADGSGGGDATLSRPTIARSFGIAVKGFRKIYAAGTRLPNEDTFTVPFFRSSVRGYPFDKHFGFLDFGAFTVNPGVSPVAPPVNSTTPLPMLVTLDTNVSGMRFVSGTPFTGTGQSKGPLFVEVNFGLQRSKITIGFSLFILGINWILSLVVGFLALQVLVNKRPVAAAVLGPPISLMFALPSLRNVQPQAPPIGSTNDVLGFFWNMVIVSLSAIAIIFAFVNRWSPPAKEAPVIPPRPSRRPSERAVDEWQLSPIHSPQSTGPRLTDKEGY